MKSLEIKHIRKDFSKDTLDERNVEAGPISQFAIWMEEVLKAGIDEPNAMMLATVGHDLQPSARIVLLRDFGEKGFVFYTNFSSRKGMQIQENPKVALTFFWKELERQVRIEGEIKKITKEESDKYFQARPLESKLSAIVSPQSEPVVNRGFLENSRDQLRKKYHEAELVRPKNWGGYIVNPMKIEFWQGRTGRLHDRILYSLVKNGWKIERLAP